MAPRLSLEALIDRVITATGYDLALLMRPPHGRRRMANVRKLMRLAREFEADEGRDLRAFLDFTATESEVGGREAEAAVDAEGHDGVRLMTVHAAKGLEFPVVAVADLGRRLSAPAPPALRLAPAEDDASGDADAGAMRVGLRLARLGHKRVGIFDWQELEERAVERDREEERRILHVAMTRAQRSLILSGAFDLDKIADDPKPTDPLIATVLRALGWSAPEQQVTLDPPPLADGAAADVRPVRVAVRTRAPGDTAASAAGRPALARSAGGDAGPGAAERPLPDPELAPPVEGASTPVRAVSYSALSLYERCGYRFYVERVLGLAPRLPGRASVEEGKDGDGAGDERHSADDLDGLAGRYARGRVVHQLLERSAREEWSPPDPRHVAELLRSEGVDADPAEASPRDGAGGRVPGGADQVRGRRRAAAAPGGPVRLPGGGDHGQGRDRPAGRSRCGGAGARLQVGCPPRRRPDRAHAALRGAAPHLRACGAAPVREAGARVVRVPRAPDEPAELRFRPTDVGPLGDELAAVAAGISEGRFEVTDRPERPLCFDCPARERLCVHGPELTLRDSAG